MLGSARNIMQVDSLTFSILYGHNVRQSQTSQIVKYLDFDLSRELTSDPQSQQHWFSIDIFGFVNRLLNFVIGLVVLEIREEGRTKNSLQSPNHSQLCYRSTPATDGLIVQHFC